MALSDDCSDVAAAPMQNHAGLSGCSHTMGSTEKKVVVETNGSGVCLIDYDNDGWLDIFEINGQAYPSIPGAPRLLSGPCSSTTQPVQPGRDADSSTYRL